VNRAGRPTLADVARRAGVSLKTASRAVNGEYGVAESTASRVREAARELGFRPNHLARSLAAGGPSAAVGLVLSAVSDPFIAAISGAVESVLAPRDLQLLSASHGDDPDRQRVIVRTFVERRLDAVIIVPAPGDASYLRTEIDHGLVVVAIDRPLEGVDVDTGVVDNRAGAEEAVARLVARGHRRIAALGNDGRLWTLGERFLGYRGGLDAAGLPFDPDLVDLNCGDAEGAARAVRRMLALDAPPTAVFAAQHMAGRGTVRVVHQTGVPLDVAVFDELVDTDLLVTPPVVVVASGPDRLGTVGATMVIERLDGYVGKGRRVVLPPLFLAQGEAYQPSVGAAGTGSATTAEVPR
jgi:LacI family transcriptional regulator, galactose operon repressor